MHIFRIFEDNFGKPARLVFDDKPQQTPSEATQENPSAPEEGNAEALKASQEQQAKLASQVEQQKLKDQLGEGPAEKYVETFRKFSRTTGFEALTATLEAATELRAGDVPFNFEDWPTLKNQAGIADFIERGIDIRTFPNGEGCREFLEGLKLNPEGATPEQLKKIEESNKVIGEMSKILKEHFEAKKSFKADTAEQAENKPFGMKTMSEGVKTLMKNFKRADGMEKTAILGAIGVGIYLLYKYKDSQVIPLWEEATLSKTLLWIGAGVGINYLSGKVSPDGKTLVQRIDWGKDIEALKDDNVMKAFAIKNGMDEDQEKLRTMYKVLNVDVRRLYELYRDAKLNSVSTGKKEIDPKQLGFYKGEVDGKALYEIIENLVQFTAVNEQTRRREEDAKERNIKYVKPTGAEIAEWKINADAAFEQKYFNGPLGNHEQTLFTAIVNEYRTTNYQEVIADWKAHELEERIPQTIHDKPLETAQEFDLEKVLDDDKFNVDVTSPGKATILGWPGIAFDITKTGDKQKAVIDSVEFPIEAGINGNRANADKIKEGIEKRVNDLISERSKTEPLLSGKTARWDEKEKRWLIRGLEYKNGTLAASSSPRAVAFFEIEEKGDGKIMDIKFISNEKGLTDYAKEYAKEGWDYVYDTGETVVKFTWNEMMVPFGNYLEAKYNRYGKPYIDKGIKSARAYLQERDLKKVLPDEFELDVNEPGKATILGYPNIEFDITTAGGTDKIKIENIEFPIDAGIKGNSQNADKLKKLIEGKVSSLVQEKAKTVPALQNKSIEWNKKEKKWFVKDVDVNGNALIGLPTTKTDLNIKIEEEGKLPRFYIGNTEIADFNELDKTYVNSAVQEAVWTDPQFGNILKGLPIKVDSIDPHPVYGTIIKGKISGLDFSAVLKSATITPNVPDIKLGINFFDGTQEGGAEKLVIKQNNGGQEFLTALSDKIYKDPYFHEPFMNLYAQIQNTDEGVWEHFSSAWETNKWYIVPTNIKGAMNGKIAHRLWYYTVQFKMFETLSFFEDAHSLNAKPSYTLQDVQTDYSNYIESAHKQAQDLSRYISTLTPEETAEEFGDLLSNEKPTVKNVRGKNINMPQGLEYINYGTPEYRALFKKYKDTITNYKYDFEGLDDLDPSIGAGADSWGVSDKAYDIHLTLLRVWSRHTRQYANSTIDTATKNYIELGVIEKIKNRLERTQIAGGGVIKKENLPKSEKEEDLDDWIK